MMSNSPVIGINLPNTCVDPDSTRRFLGLFSEAGFNAAELCLDTWPLILDGEICTPWLEWLEKLLPQYPLRYSAHIGRGLNLRDMERREKHAQVLRSSIDICARLGMSPLVLHYEVQSRNQAVERYFLEAHREAAEYAQARGVLLVVENIEVELVDPVIDFIARIDHPNLRMAFDTGHAFLAARYFKFDFMDAFRNALPWLAHLHLSDNTGVFEELRITNRPAYDSLPMGYRIEFGRGDIHLPPYFGKIPYDELFSQLDSYEGMFVCEYYVERFLPFLAKVQTSVREGILKNRKLAKI
jgi:sugar phosphate isomerase/epimerase